MAVKPKNAELQEISELIKRIEWMDDQRRKSTHKISELEQRFTLQEQALATREKRIQDLERQLSQVSAQLARIPQVDVQLSQFKDEMVTMIEGYDKRRIQGEKEIDRLRRIEHESVTREIVDIRKDLPAIARLQHEMELRQAEETRLANLIGIQQNSIPPIRNQIEDWERALTFLEEKEKQNRKNIGEFQTQFIDINKRWDPINMRIDIIANTLSKSESTRQDLIDSQVEQRETIKKWAEQIQLGEHERNKQLEKWRYEMDEQKDTIERFSREWVKFSDQYKEAKMAVQTLAEWQKQIEQRQQESSELLKVELNRLQSRWDGFVLENAQKWKTFEVEAEQRWANISRVEKQFQDQILALEEKLVKIREEKDTLRRVQVAQADAIKKIPHIWIEEVEKAIAQDPNRRRQPTTIPVREE
ncbi:MAG: hypothetical protein KDE48_06630 [Anaerolineales bacterium]|nr:hypothetical protein [Anaerolineales bacterium]